MRMRIGGRGPAAGARMRRRAGCDFFTFDRSDFFFKRALGAFVAVRARAVPRFVRGTRSTSRDVVDIARLDRHHLVFFVAFASAVFATVMGYSPNLVAAKKRTAKHETKDETRMGWGQPVQLLTTASVENLPM